MAVSIKRRMLNRRPRGAGFLDDSLRVRSRQPVPAQLDGLDPFRVLTERHTGNAVPVGLLLDPARVGEDHAGLRGESGEVEVTERRTCMHVPTQPVPLLLDCCCSPGMEWKDDRFLQGIQRLDDAAECGLADVCFTVDG